MLALPSGHTQRKLIPLPYDCLLSVWRQWSFCPLPSSSWTVSVLAYSPHHSWFLWHMRSITFRPPYISQCLLLYRWSQATANIKSSLVLLVAWSQTDVHPGRICSWKLVGVGDRKEKFPKKAELGNDENAGIDESVSWNSRVRSALRIWTTLKRAFLGQKALKRNKPAVSRVVNPNQRNAHLNYKKSPLETVTAPSSDHRSRKSKV